MVKNEYLNKSIAIFVLITLMIFSNQYWEGAKLLSILSLIGSSITLYKIEWEDKGRDLLLLFLRIILSISIFNILSSITEDYPIVYFIITYFLLLLFPSIFDSDEEISEYFLKFFIIGLLYWFIAMVFRKLDITWLGVIAAYTEVTDPLATINTDPCG